MAGRATASPPQGANQCYFGLASALGASDPPPTLHVAIVGGAKETILEGFRLCPGSRVLLLHTRGQASRARRLRSTFRRAGIEAVLQPTGDEPYWGVLRALNGVIHESRLAYREILVNVSSGSAADGCAAVTAAYLHGLKAFSVGGEEARLLPVLPASQRALLSEADVSLLLALTVAPQSARALARRSRLSDAEVEAHLDGEPGRKGLLGLGLVERSRLAGILPRVRLTRNGRALVESGALAARPTV